MRARNISTRLWTTRVGSRRSGNTWAKLSAKPRRRSAIARSITPPFEVRRPPSKAAVTFLASTAGNENGRIVSSVMAGVAFAVEGDGVGFATESYAASALYTTLASLAAALWRIRRARLAAECCSVSTRIRALRWRAGERNKQKSEQRRAGEQGPGFVGAESKRRLLDHRTKIGFDGGVRYVRGPVQEQL